MPLKQFSLVKDLETVHDILEEVIPPKLA